MTAIIKILQATVGLGGWRKPSATSRTRRHLLVPAQPSSEARVPSARAARWFWTVQWRHEIRSRAATIAKMAKQSGVAIFGGIDLRRFSKFKVTQEADRLGTIPGFAIAVDANGHYTIGRQRSTRSTHSLIKVRKIMVPTRSVAIQGRTITYLLCGELYNRTLRADLARQKPSGIAVLGHWNMPRRTPSARALSQTAGCPVWISQRLEHTRSMPGYSGSYTLTTYAPPGPSRMPRGVWSLGRLDRPNDLAPRRCTSLRREGRKALGVGVRAGTKRVERTSRPRELRAVHVQRERPDDEGPRRVVRIRDVTVQGIDQSIEVSRMLLSAV